MSVSIGMVNGECYSAGYSPSGSCRFGETVGVAIFLALVGAFFFGVLSVLVRRALRSAPDAVAGAFVTDIVAFAAAAAVAAAAHSGLGSLSWHTMWPYLLAGFFVPGISQILFVYAIKLSGPSRTSTAVGAAPLISAFIAIVVLGEPFRAWLILGTVFVVAGGVSLAWDKRRPEHFQPLGLLFAGLCAVLFGARDNIVRWAQHDGQVPPLVAATIVLGAASVTAFAYLAIVRRRQLPTLVRRAAVPFILPGLAIGFAYDGLTEAFSRAKVTIVAPLNATSALWGVLASLVLMRRAENIGRRLILAAALIVAGAIVVGATR
jgi:transporter family protein